MMTVAHSLEATCIEDVKNAPKASEESRCRPSLVKSPAYAYPRPGDVQIQPPGIKSNIRSRPFAYAIDEQCYGAGGYIVSENMMKGTCLDLMLLWLNDDDPIVHMVAENYKNIYFPPAPRLLYGDQADLSLNQNDPSTWPIVEGRIYKGILGLSADIYREAVLPTNLSSEVENMFFESRIVDKVPGSGVVAEPGDSGGPVVLRRGDTVEVLGIVSSSVCRSDGTNCYGRYTRLDEQATFLGYDSNGITYNRPVVNWIRDMLNPDPGSTESQPHRTDPPTPDDDPDGL